MRKNLQSFLEEKVIQYNRPGFIVHDPISIPHMFSKKQDIEIAGFFAAILAWGQRKTILKKCKDLMDLMENSPYEFILHHQDTDLKPFVFFKHRTFNDVDTLYFIHFLSWFYKSHSSLEEAFLGTQNEDPNSMESMLIHFQNLFFSLEHAPRRTKKHISSPATNSACKRLNMFLRWMVRKDSQGVDFGIWNKIRVGRKLGLITRKQTDWLTALELTQALREFDPLDPVKFDFALFGLGIEEKF